MPSLSDRIRRLKPRPVEPCIHVPLDDHSIERLMRLLCETRDDELTCEEVFSRLDEYVDCLMARREVGEIQLRFEQHLTICQDCHDELEALVHALESAAEG